MKPYGFVPEPLLTATLELSGSVIVGIALDGVVQTWSPGAQAMYGYTADEIVGSSLNRLIPIYDHPRFAELLEQAKKGKIPCCEETERMRKDAMTIVISTRRILIREKDGAINGILEMAETHDICGATVPSEKQQRLLLEQLPVALWTVNRNLQITSTWGSTPNISKTKPEKAIGKSIFEYLESADRHATPIVEHYEALLGASSHFEYALNEHVLEIRVKPLQDTTGKIIGCLGMAIDVTNRKRSEDEIRFQATHDALTGLANYREFIGTIDREVRRAERSRHSFTVLLMDLDGLKKINDRLGHLAGNRALKRLATVMQIHCRSTDLAARYGGDEFGVILLDSDQRMAEQVAGRIENHLKNDKEDPVLSVSIGISVYPDDGRTTQELLEAADQQLYRRKKQLYARGVATK